MCNVIYQNLLKTHKLYMSLYVNYTSINTGEKYKRKAIYNNQNQRTVIQIFLELS